VTYISEISIMENQIIQKLYQQDLFNLQFSVKLID